MIVLKNWHGLLNPAGKHRGMVYNHDLYVAPTLYKEMVLRLIANYRYQVHYRRYAIGEVFTAPQS